LPEVRIKCGNTEMRGLAFIENWLDISNSYNRNSFDYCVCLYESLFTSRQRISFIHFHSAFKCMCFLKLFFIFVHLFNCCKGEKRVHMPLCTQERQRATFGSHFDFLFKPYVSQVMSWRQELFCADPCCLFQAYVF